MRNENLELAQSSGSESSPGWMASGTATPKASTFNFEFGNPNQPAAPPVAPASTAVVDDITAKFKGTLTTSRSHDELSDKDGCSSTKLVDADDAIKDQGGGLESSSRYPAVFADEDKRSPKGTGSVTNVSGLYPPATGKSRSLCYDDGGGSTGDLESSTSSIGGSGAIMAGGEAAKRSVLAGKESKIARFLRRTQSANEDSTANMCAKTLDSGKGEQEGIHHNPQHSSLSGLPSSYSGQKGGDDAAATSSSVSGEEGRGSGAGSVARSKRHKFASVGTDMKLRLGFLKRRHTEGQIHSASVRPPPEEALKWGNSFTDLMASKYGQALFKAFLQREFSEENIEFWLAIEDYRKTRQNKLNTKAQKIYNDFIIPQAPKEVNLDTLTKDSLVTKMSQPTHTTFDQAQKRIQGVLEADAYSRFLKSDLYLELVHPEKYQQDLFINSKENDANS